MSSEANKSIKGRGAQANFVNRFDRLSYETDYENYDFDELEEQNGIKTTYLEVFPKSLVNKVLSKDIFLNWSMNPYQGCEHGCTYCYARTTHEFWGYNASLDFERQVMYKPNAPELLRSFLNKKSWKPEAILLSGNTDCYQPIDRKLGITRQLLRVMQTFQNPVGIITKNSLIERDLDILTEMAKHNLARVLISITTLDEDLRMKMEPRTSTVKNRLKTIERLSAAGIPTQVMIGPIIPGLTSHEMPEIIKRSAEHGAEWANFTMVRLNGVVAEVFENWLTTAYPDRASKVLNQIKEVNGGKLANTIAGARMTGKGDTAQTITNLFKLYRDKYMVKPNQEFAHHFFKRLSDQFSLF